MQSLRDMLYKTKKQMGGNDSAANVLMSKNKQLRSLENRLEKALTKLNETVHL